MLFYVYSLVAPPTPLSLQYTPQPVEWVNHVLSGRRRLKPNSASLPPVLTECGFVVCLCISSCLLRRGVCLLRRGVCSPRGQACYTASGAIAGSQATIVRVLVAAPMLHRACMCPVQQRSSTQCTASNCHTLTDCDAGGEVPPCHLVECSVDNQRHVCAENFNREPP